LKLWDTLWQCDVVCLYCRNRFCVGIRHAETITAPRFCSPEAALAAHWKPGSGTFPFGKAVNSNRIWPDMQTITSLDKAIQNCLLIYSSLIWDRLLLSLFDLKTHQLFGQSGEWVSTLEHQELVETTGDWPNWILKSLIPDCLWKPPILVDHKPWRMYIWIPQTNQCRELPSQRGWGYSCRVKVVSLRFYSSSTIMGTKKSPLIQNRTTLESFLMSRTVLKVSGPLVRQSATLHTCPGFHTRFQMTVWSDFHSSWGQVLINLNPEAMFWEPISHGLLLVIPDWPSYRFWPDVASFTRTRHLAWTGPFRSYSINRYLSSEYTICLFTYKTCLPIHSPVVESLGQRPHTESRLFQTSSHTYIRSKAIGRRPISRLLNQITSQNQTTSGFIASSCYLGQISISQDPADQGLRLAFTIVFASCRFKQFSTSL